MSTLTQTIPTRVTSRGGWKDTLGRVGLIGRGVLYAVVGLLALQLALGDVGNDASTSGAVRWIADRPFGTFLLVALTVSLFALAAWRALDAVVGDPVEGDEASDRARYAAKAVLYLVLAVVALTATVDSWSGSSSSSGSGGSGEAQGQQASSTVLDWPGGRWILAAAGVAVVAYAVRTLKRHTIDETFLERLDGRRPGWVEPVGRAGYAAKAVVFALIGWFLVQTALTHDPERTKGVSGALQELAGSGWGRWVLAGVAVGFLAMGAFMVAEGKYRRAA